MRSRLAPALLAAAAFVAVSTTTRLALALRPDVSLAGGAADWARVFAHGLAFDLIAASYVAAPLVLWLALVPNGIARSRPHRALAVAGFAAVLFGALLLAASEWLFWDEFGGRFNFIAVDYVLYTHEVLHNIWESYPVGKVLLGLLALAASGAFLLRRRLWAGAGAPLGWRAALVVVAAVGAAVAGSLRWVDSDLKNFSAADAANDLAGNGLYELFAANYRNELSYERHYATIPLEEAMARVRRALGAGGEGVERHVVSGVPEKRLNVVLVSVESLGA